eukprot:200216-Rhodomonas_salina.6
MSDRKRQGEQQHFAMSSANTTSFAERGLVGRRGHFVLANVQGTLSSSYSRICGQFGTLAGVRRLLSGTQHTCAGHLSGLQIR